MNRLLPLLLLACDGPDSAPVSTPTPAGPPNILLFIADDLGLDNVGVYEHPRSAPTPTIDRLAAEGVRFDTTWATPSCSPARAQILTGRHGRRYGMGVRIDMSRDGDTFALPLEETTLGEVAQAAGYSTSFVGKWHLTSFDAGWESAPSDQGFEWFAITGGNLNITSIPVESGYFFWERNENGISRFVDGYTTSVQADDAVSRLQAMPEPWLLVVSFNAPHEPWHTPPFELHSAGLLTGTGPSPKYRAAVEAMDTEMARVIDAIPTGQAENTHVVFVSDNGTPLQALQPPTPFNQGKPSLTEGGLRVPLIFTGPGIAPGQSGALTGLVDVFPTLAGFMGAELVDADGQPLALDGYALQPWIDDPALPSARTVLYADRFSRNGDPDAAPNRTQYIRDARWKYGRNQAGTETLFDLQSTLWDTDDLVRSGDADAQVLERMRDLLDAAVAERPYEY